ncbi:MAG: bifunctional phosphoribosylaminoimidazolecarboxamide formyltransferase/IMP cyclohydrolase [Bacteroidota bacterium]|nr:bifunctional phosphoribosylaminoimidazolecarboxamide formyltransferase/IMP cyclohydrolase [Bacteroidota bacterium]
MSQVKITSTLISVYNKEGLAPIISKLNELKVKIYSTGGTEKFIKDMGVPVTAVEDLTGYPSIFGGRVKTLHPKIFGGILYRRDESIDLAEAKQYEIPPIDMVIVDLYPFEDTVKAGGTEEEIIEKIDIGGISLIRAAAKNFESSLIVSSREQYAHLLELLHSNNGQSTREQRLWYATYAFDITSHYDSAIFNWFNQKQGIKSFKQSVRTSKTLRYGENPHQKGTFYGNLDELFDILNGKELSYNNLVDVDACVALIDEFNDELKKGLTTFAIIKHTNACGVASAKTVKEAYLTALACDPVSAFGGVIITNSEVDLATAQELNQLFFEVLIAPSYAPEALALFREKKNRIILKRKPVAFAPNQFKTLLNGIIDQDKDLKIESIEDMKTVTTKAPTDAEKRALVFANKLVKHTKSNTIILAKENCLISSGVGQTSRVDSLKQALEKAHSFGFSVKGAVMASDAFFPFPDCVEIAHKAGVTAVLQPGGSVKDKDSIDYCDQNGVAMVFTGVRHFKH